MANSKVLVPNRTFTTLSLDLHEIYDILAQLPYFKKTFLGGGGGAFINRGGVILSSVPGKYRHTVARRIGHQPHVAVDSSHRGGHWRGQVQLTFQVPHL